MKPAGFLRRSIRVGRSLRQAAREKWRGFARSLVGRLFGGKAHCRSLGYPRIPVKFYGVDELHAAFLTESRTRGPVMCSVAGIRGSLPMNKIGWAGFASSLVGLLFAVRAHCRSLHYAALRSG